ncbi:oxidoreductase [Microbacterium sp. CIAB417]|uniref:oxidoreductase n=1 Tax=Microbacterium sp. CIAB417 TaxID=2860287 RepID=UPI001FAE588E|nr:oxidoreductase [Microbacterium sp. CIAB417]
MNRLASATDIPDQTGRTAVITGGSSGIGFAAARALARKGARVTIGVRDLDRGRDAARTIGNGAVARHLDLASLRSVRGFADEIDGPVDYLINNAGAMSAERRVTEDGFEQQFGVNHLGHFALTNLLLNRVTRRITTVTSATHRSARIDFDDLQWERRPYRPFGAYGQSKLANLLFTAELQRRLSTAGSSVSSTASHPGWAATGFAITSGNRVVDRLSRLATPLMAHGPEGGALPTLLAATGDVPGGSLSGPGRLGIRGPAALVASAPSAQDDETARRLWDVSEDLTSTRFSFEHRIA